MIHPTAVVDPMAEIAAGVCIGPWSNIGAGVTIGHGCEIAGHVHIEGPTRIGRDNRFFPFSSIGTEPQDKKFSGEKESELVIGNGNTVREMVTINRGTQAGGGKTILGDNNWIMAYVHIAHDCIVGSHTIFSNNAGLAGHVTVGDHATLGAWVGVHQFCRLGSYSFAASTSVIAQDVPPFVLMQGNRARPRGLNLEGLRRHDFPEEEVSRLKKAYHLIYREGLKLEEAVHTLAPQAKDSNAVALLLDFLRVPGRQLAR